MMVWSAAKSFYVHTCMCTHMCGALVPASAARLPLPVLQRWLCCWGQCRGAELEVLVRFMLAAGCMHRMPWACRPPFECVAGKGLSHQSGGATVVAVVRYDTAAAHHSGQHPCQHDLTAPDVCCFIHVCAGPGAGLALQQVGSIIHLHPACTASAAFTVRADSFNRAPLWLCYLSWWCAACM